MSVDELSTEIIELGQTKQFPDLQELVAKTDVKLVSLWTASIAVIIYLLKINFRFCGKNYHGDFPILLRPYRD